jgi:hypothetical protein
VKFVKKNLKTASEHNLVRHSVPLFGIASRYVAAKSKALALHIEIEYGKPELFRL